MQPKRNRDKSIRKFTVDDPTPGIQLLDKRQRMKNIIILALSTFLTGTANMIHFTFYNPYFLEIKDSERLIGIIGTVTSFVAILGLIISDYLNSLLGYKRVYIIGLTLVASSFVFFIFRPQNIIWIIIAVIILSFAFSLNESPVAILLTETAGEEKKGKISSLTSFFGKLGEIIVSSIIPALAVIISFTNIERSYFYSYSAGIYLIIIILIIIFVTDPSKILGNIATKEEEKSEEIEEDLDISEPVLEFDEENSNQDKKLKGFLDGFIDTFRDKWVLRVALTFFTDAILWSIALGVHIPGLLDEDVFGVNRLNDEKLSIMFLATNIVVLIAMFPSGWFADKLGAKALLFTSELCGLGWAILSVIFVFFSQYFWIIILSRVALGLSIALWIPSTIALFTNVETKRKSKVYNSIAIFRTIGWLPGGLIAGFLYDAIPQPYGFLTPIFILIAGMSIIIPVFYTLPNKPPANNGNEIKTEELTK